MRSKENVLARAESGVIYRKDYTGADSGGSSTVESLQHATDGEDQHTEVSRERYTEVHRGQTGAGH